MVETLNIITVQPDKSPIKIDNILVHLDYVRRNGVLQLTHNTITLLFEWFSVLDLNVIVGPGAINLRRFERKT